MAKHWDTNISDFNLLTLSKKVKIISNINNINIKNKIKEVENCSDFFTWKFFKIQGQKKLSSEILNIKGRNFEIKNFKSTWW